MRIGIDATTIYTARPTGLGIYSINVINELAKIHDNIVVWTVDDSRLNLRPEQVRRVMQPFRFLGNQLFQLRPLWVQWILPRLIKKEGVDILYTTIPNGLCGSPVPHILTVHDIIPLVFPEDAPRMVRWNFRYRLPKIFDQATTVIAVSDYTRQDLLRHYALDPAKVVVVSEGYDRENFRPRNDLAGLEKYGLTPGGYLLYVGNSSPRKNVARLIEGFARVRDSFPHDLVLAGSKIPTQIAQIKSTAARYKVSDRVKLLDYVPYGDLGLLYSGAALFAFVSEYEGFGLPVLEAMACGVPVLAADSTSLPEVVGDAAMLVNPRDAKGIGDALRTILGDEWQRAEMKRKSLARCREFSWEKTAREILRLCKAGLSS
ncbi:glycosyltransferase family 4 protein [Geothermobacter ehrlichii]|uniref:glycosyltransferase family 4 protein n=1 Tax=Geothermobacter ehrlichii TaxID=213224 RepID=UPI001652D458|nr:glycosyltransferase family 1 protein [Geothermobacter ehrlichii]